MFKRHELYIPCILYYSIVFTLSFWYMYSLLENVLPEFDYFFLLFTCWIPQKNELTLDLLLFLYLFIFIY